MVSLPCIFAQSIHFPSLTSHRLVQCSHDDSSPPDAQWSSRPSGYMYALPHPQAADFIPAIHTQYIYTAILTNNITIHDNTIPNMSVKFALIPVNNATSDIPIYKDIILTMVDATQDQATIDILGGLNTE